MENISQSTLESIIIRAQIELLNQLQKDCSRLQSLYHEESESDGVESLFAKGLVTAYKGRSGNYGRRKERLQNRLIKLLSE